MASPSRSGLEAVPLREEANLEAGCDDTLGHAAEDEAASTPASAEADGALAWAAPRLGRRTLLGGAALMALAAMCALVARPAARGPAALLLGAGGLEHLAKEYDPLSTSAAGMPGMPMGVDGSPGDSANPQKGSMQLAGADKCRGNEELLMGLCYQKCSVLTNGTFVKRVAPGGCCKELDLRCVKPSEVDFNGLLPGSGYNVDGSGGNPHPPGLCDGNEEVHAGMCYKKCSILTDNKYPMRSAASTCCKALPCWNPLNVKTEGTGVCTGFNIGGGLVGHHNCPHSPSVDEAP